MAKISFVVFSLALVLSIQFVVGQKDEVASPEGAVMTDFGEHLNKIITDTSFMSGVAKLVEKFKSSVGDDSESVDGTTFVVADEVAASPESTRVFPASIMSGIILALPDGEHPNFLSGVDKLVQQFKGSVGVSVDGPTSALADEVAGSPESEVKIVSRKMGKDGLANQKAIQERGD